MKSLLNIVMTEIKIDLAARLDTPYPELAPSKFEFDLYQDILKLGEVRSNLSAVTCRHTSTTFAIKKVKDAFTVEVLDKESLFEGRRKVSKELMAAFKDTLRKELDVYEKSRLEAIKQRGAEHFKNSYEFKVLIEDAQERAVDEFKNSDEFLLLLEKMREGTVAQNLEDLRRRNKIEDDGELY